MDIGRSTSRHFSLQQLGEGIFAAIANDGCAAICNAGLIDLGGQVVIFDTFQTPQAAEGLARAALDLFGQSPLTVVNSHWHSDHIWGNQVFAKKAPILSSTRTRQLIGANSPKEVEYYRANAAQQLADFQAKLAEASDEQREGLALMVGIYEGLTEAMPHFSLCLPSITFDHHLTLYGTKRAAELIHFENGHTESDTVLFLPKEEIIFTSDLFFVDFHPYLGDGDPQGQKAALRTLSQMEVKTFVPGHGRVGTREDIRRLNDYIDYCVETAQTLVREGAGYEEKIAGLPITEDYQDWKIPNFFTDNIRFLCKRAAQAGGG